MHVRWHRGATNHFANPPLWKGAHCNEQVFSLSPTKALGPAEINVDTGHYKLRHRIFSQRPSLYIIT